MNLDGRKRFFVAYERRMEREFTSQQPAKRSTLPRDISRKAFETLRGEANAALATWSSARP